MEQTRQLVRTNKITFAVPLSLISMQELSYKQYVDPSESARGLSEISCTEWVGAPLREAARQMHAFAVGMGGAVQLPTLSENMVVPSSASMPSGGNRKQAQLSLFTGKPVSCCFVRFAVDDLILGLRHDCNRSRGHSPSLYVYHQGIWP